MPETAQNLEETDHNCQKYLQLTIDIIWAQFPANQDLNTNEKQLRTQLYVTLISFHAIII